MALIKNAQGKVNGNIGVLRDVTERKRAEEELRQSEQRLALAASGTRIGMFDCNMATGEVLSTEQHVKHLGLPTTTTTTTTTTTLTQSYHYSQWALQVHPEDLPAVEMENRRCLAERLVFEAEYRVVWPDGSVHWIDCRRVFPQETPGAPQRMLGISMDITERKWVEQALQEAQAKLKAHAENLEKTVTERTAKLWEQTAEREKLQEELLKISEREKQLIAQELHDGLCQHFAGTAMMVSLLHRRMVATQDPHAAQAKEICELLSTGVVEARNLSHGLHPVKDKGDGLMESLTGLAQTVTKLFHVQCTFCCDDEVLINEQATATHLFRITQEAVNNAMKHGQASKVLITLKNGSEGVSLSIRDNGIGIPRKLPATKGMGMQIMNHRAEVIGAWLTVCRAGKRGTLVTCTLPERNLASQDALINPVKG